MYSADFVRRVRSDACDAWQHPDCSGGDFGCHCSCHLHLGQPVLIDLAGVLHAGTVAGIDVDTDPEHVAVNIAEHGRVRRIPIHWVNPDIAASTARSA
jgi:hypothetical protein